MGMDLNGLNPKAEIGEDFSANVWGWHCIHCLSDKAMEVYGLPYGTDGWQHNDGKGLKNQEECDKLADAIEGYFTDNPLDDDILEVESDQIWVTRDGIIQIAEEGKVRPKSARTPYYIKKEKIDKWVEFLRNCGGFEIW